MLKNNKKGFTIIEVVLVLAIAGLIFMMVFIALPALQRNRRDTQRKSDLSRLQGAITNYASNNRGKVPNLSMTAAAGTTSKGQSFIDNYLKIGDDEFIDPAGATQDQIDDKGGEENVTYVFQECTNEESGTCISGSWNDNKNVIYYRAGAVCGDTENTWKTSNSRKMAVLMKLEGGGVYCLSNR